MADNIKVVIKVRPLIKREIDDNQQSLWRVSDNTIFPIEQFGNSTIYTFDNVFGETSQTQDVYDKVARDIVDAAVDGINGTIFAYGQTSSGKTFTMMGDDESPGVIPLAIQNIFSTIESRVDRDFLLRVSYIEIYNERIRDLLDVNKTDLKVHEDLNGQVSVKCTEEVTSTPFQVLKLMRKGDLNRSTGETQMNERSSRSHTIFQIIIESRKHVSESSEEENCANVSQLNLVDLAGSERASQTGATKLRLREGGLINKSLCTLSLVIRRLSETQGDPQRFINFRDSKLTRILQTSLGGNTKTGIICAVTPATLDETHSTLMFAMRAKNIKNKPKVNEVMSDATQLKRLTKEISVLQNELHSRKLLEADMMKMQEQMGKMKNQILMGNVVFVPTSKATVQRRKTWSASQHSISSLAPIQEDSTTDFTLNRFQSNNDLGILRLSNVTERDDSILSHRDSTSSCLGRSTPRDSTKHYPPDEIICLDDSIISEKSPSCSPIHKCYANPMKPPCVLIRENRYIRKELTELEELTSLEQRYPYEVNDLLKQLHDLRQLQFLSEKKLIEFEEREDVLNKQNEKLTEEKALAEKLKMESEKKMIVYQCENVDIQFQMDQLKERSQKREKELLSSLKEARGDDAHSVSHQHSYYLNFLNMSQDISLAVNSDGEPSLTEMPPEVQPLLPAPNKTEDVTYFIDEEAVTNIDCSADGELSKIKVNDTDHIIQINNLKLQIDQRNSEIDQLKSEILESTFNKTENETLKASALAVKETVDKLLADNALLQLKSEEQDKTIDALRSSLMNLNIELDGLKNSYISIEKKFTDSEECISYLETDIESLEIKIEVKSRLVDSLKTEVASLESAKRDYNDMNELIANEGDKNAFEKNIETLKMSLDEKQSEIEELNTTLQSINCQISIMSKEMLNKDDKLKEQEQCIQSLTDACNNSIDEITNLKLSTEESILNKSKEISDLKCKIEILNNDLTNMHSALQEADSSFEMNQLKSLNENLTEKLSYLEGNNQELLKKIFDSEEIIANRFNEICQLKLSVDTLNGKLSTLHCELEKNTDRLGEMAQVKIHNSELLQKILMQEGAIEKSSIEIPELKYKIDVLNNTILALQCTLEQNEVSSQFKLNQLKSEYDDMLNKLASAEDKSKELLRQVTGHEEIIAVKSDELHNLYQNNASLNIEIAHLQSELKNDSNSQVEFAQLKIEYKDLSDKLSLSSDCNDKLFKQIAEYEEVILNKSKDISDLQCAIELLNADISRLESNIHKNNNDLQFERSEIVNLKRQIDHFKQDTQKNQSLIKELNMEICNNKNLEIHKNILNNLENNKENVQKLQRKLTATPSPNKFKQDAKRLLTPKCVTDTSLDTSKITDKISQLNVSLKSEVELSEKLKEKMSILENTNNELKNLLRTVQKEIMDFNFVLSQFKNIIFCDCEKMINAKQFIEWFSELTHRGLCAAIEKYSFDNIESDEKTSFIPDIQTNPYHLETLDDKNVEIENYSVILARIESDILAASIKLNIPGVVYVQTQNNVLVNDDNENMNFGKVLSLHSLFIKEIEEKINTIEQEDDKLKMENESLKIEVDEARLSIGELVKESEELHRKILGQRSDQIVSMAEFTLLTSRLAAMQHYHNNLHTFSASTVAHVSQELFLLQSMLRDKTLSDRDSNEISFQLFNNKCQQFDQSSQLIEESSENNFEDGNCRTETVAVATCVPDLSSADTIQDRVDDYQQLIENFKSKCDENTGLLDKIIQFDHHMKAYKTLQDDYDSLSMELMESLQEVDTLKKQITFNEQKIEKITVSSSIQAVIPSKNSSIQTSPCKVSYINKESNGELNSDVSKFPPEHDKIRTSEDIESIDKESFEMSDINNEVKVDNNIKFLEGELRNLCNLSDCKCPENMRMKSELNKLRLAISESTLPNGHPGIGENLSLNNDNDVTQNILLQVEDNINDYHSCKELIEEKLLSKSILYGGNSTLIELFNSLFDSVESKNHCVIENLQKELLHTKEIVQSLQCEVDSRKKDLLDCQMNAQNSSDDFKKLLETLNEQCVSLNQTIDNCRNDVSNITEELNAERSAKNLLIHEKCQFKSEIEDFSSKIVRLESIEIELRGHINILESEKRDIADQNELSNNEQTKLKNQINSLEDRLASLMTAEAKLLDTIAKRDDEILLIKQEACVLTENRDNLIEKNNADIITITSLGEELKLHISKIEELERQSTKNENDSKYADEKYNSVLEENTKCKREIQSLRESVTAMESQIIVGGRDKSEIAEHVNRLKCELEESDRVNRELLDQNNNANATLSNLTKQNFDLNEKMSHQIKRFEELNAEFLESCEANAKKVLNLEKDVSEKVFALNNQLSKISELTLQVYNQNHQINNINVQMKCKEEERCSLLSNIDGLSVLLNEKEQEIKDVSWKLQEMKSISDEIVSIQAENAELREKIVNTELISENLKTSISSLNVYKDNHNKLIDELQMAKQQLETKERKLHELTSINSILQTRTDDLQAELNSMIKNSPRARNDLKLRRQSMHDMKRNINFNNSSIDGHMEVNINPSPDDIALSAKNLQLEEHLESAQTRLREVQEEYKTIADKYHECKTLLTETSTAYNKLLYSFKILETKLAESKRSQISPSVINTQDATTNTNTDLSEPLMALCVDKMTHEAVKEKSKQLQKKNEDLICRNKELCVEIRRLQHSLQNNTVHNLLPNNDRTRSDDSNLLEKIKSMESVISQREKEIKEWEIKYSDLDNECDLCIKELRDREENCTTMYKEKKILEAEVENLKYEIDSRRKDSPSRETQRKRHNMYDANRSISTNSIDSLGKTQEDSQSLKIMRETCNKLQINLDALNNRNIQLQAEMQTLKDHKSNTRSAEQSYVISNPMSLNKHSSLTDPGVHSAPVPSFYMPVPMATLNHSHLHQPLSSGIVQNQKLSEYMAENQKLKDVNEKLKTICHKRAAKIKLLEETKANK